MGVRFVAVGELLVDVIAAGAGHGARISVRPAGSAFNAAVAAVAAGADASVIGTVGDDAVGRMILAELAAVGVHADVAMARGSSGTFLLSDGEARVDRGVGHDLVLPARIEADVVLVSGYVPSAADALAAAEAEWVALDAGRTADPPAGGNALFVSREAAGEPPVPTGDRRLVCVTRGQLGAEARLDGRTESVRPTRIAPEGPGSGDAFAATLLVALSQGDDLRQALERASQAALDSLG
jgi:sugar/nucleoside kinase (ribokinase family)